jgi:chromosome segregation ATPase
LSHGEKLQRAKKLRESEIEAARTELNTVLTGLGRAAVQARSGPLTAEINSLLECEKRRDHFDELIERLQAGHRADLLEQECAEIERRQADVEGRIKKLQDELTDLADSLREKRSRQDELRRRRGDESELFDA